MQDEAEHEEAGGILDALKNDASTPQEKETLDHPQSTPNRKFAGRPTLVIPYINP